MATTHEIEAPNGMIYTFEAPDDASDADLFRYTKHLMEQEKAHQAKTGIIPAAKHGFQGALGSADVGIAGALKGLGFPEEAAGFEKSAKERQAKAQEAYEPTTEEDVAAAEARGVLPGAIANLRKNVGEPIGGMAGRFGPTTAAVMLGGVPGAALAGGAEYLTSAGEIQERGGSPEAAYTMAAPVAALNTLGLPLGPLSRTVSGLLSKVLGRAVPEVAEQSVLGAAKKAQEVATQEGLNALGQLKGKAVVEAEAAPFRAATKAASEKAAEFAGSRTKSQLAGDIATSTLGNVAVATPTVLAQEAMIRSASGEEQQTPEEMMATAKQMALLSPFFGALHGTMRNPNLDVQRKAMETAESVRTRPEALAAEENIRNFAEPEVPEPTKRGATPVVEEPEAVAPEEVAPEEVVTPAETVAPKSDAPYHSMTLEEYQANHPNPYRAYNKILKTDISKMTDEDVLSQFTKDDLRVMAKALGTRISGPPAQLLGYIRTAMSNRDMMVGVTEGSLKDLPVFKLKNMAKELGAPPHGNKATLINTLATWRENNIKTTQRHVAGMNLGSEIARGVRDGENVKLTNGIVPAETLFESYLTENTHPETYDAIINQYASNIVNRQKYAREQQLQIIADNLKTAETPFEKQRWEDLISSVNQKISNQSAMWESQAKKIAELKARREGAVEPTTPESPAIPEAVVPEAPVTPIETAPKVKLGKALGFPPKTYWAKELNKLDTTDPEHVVHAADIIKQAEEAGYTGTADWEAVDAMLKRADEYKANPPVAEPVKPVEPVEPVTPAQAKVDEALKAKEEAVAKHTEEPTPENTAEAIKSTIMHDAAEREAAKPVVEDTTPPLKAEEPKVSETPTDAESTLLADRYSTTRERQNLSLMDKVKDFTKNVVRRHTDKWAPAMEKVGKQYGMYTPEGIFNVGYLGHQFDQAANMMEQAAIKGGLRLREDGQVEIREEPIKLHTGEATNASIVNMHKLINSLGVNGKDIINEILRVKDEARQLKLDPTKVSKKVSQNPQAFQEKVKAADQYIKDNPVVQDIINMYRKVHEMQIDFHEQTGTIDKKLGDFFRSQEDYSPRYEMREEVLDKLGADKVNRTPIGGMFTKTFKERTGADHEVNSLENIANQFTGDYMKSWYNHVKSHMADQFTKVGAAKYVGRTKSPTNQGNVAVLRNGKREFYTFENPEDLPAMQIAANSLGPLAAATKASHALRFGALSTPGFWAKELARNPLAATLTSDLGWLTPAHSMYEVTKILRGDNEVFHKLQNAGIVGSVDPVLDPREGRSFTRNLGTKVQDVSASKKTVGALLRNVENFHTVFDAATKCAVYRMAYDKGIREGMSPRKADGYAITKARESFNHNVSGSSEMQRNARLLIPFLGSGINALELLRKSIMMPHIKESERAAYRQQFVNKAATVAMLSGAYAFMMAGDPEYEKQKSNFKYSNILVPTGMEDHPYIGVALPPDIAFLHWLPNMMVQYTLGSRSGSDLWDDMKDQLKLMVPGGLAYTAGIPIPQAVKPLLEATMGKSSYSGQDIISKADQSKLPEERGEFTSSLTAKTIGKATGISPPIIDHLATGYLAEIGKMAMWASDAFLSTLGVEDGITKPEKEWTQTPGLGLQGVFGQHLGSQSLDDFYTHKEEADQLRKTFNDMQKAGASRKDDLKEFIDDKERMFKKNAATQMDTFAKQMTALENQNRLIMRSKLPEDEITRRVEANKKQRNELAKRANQYWAKQISSYASGGEIEGLYDKVKKQNFKPGDSMIVSSIMHPVTALEKMKALLNQKVLNASGVLTDEQLADNPNPLFGPSPEQQAKAALDLSGYAGTGATPFNRVGGAGTTGMFAGLNSATADKSKALEAAKLLREGASKEGAYAKTGWFQGPEQAWRYEIDDAPAKLRYPMEDIAESELFRKAKLYNLGDILDHPELYKAYPELAEVGFMKRKGLFDMGGLQGWRDSEANVIGVTPYAEDPLGTLLHEAQHYIQEKEKFGLGGNSDTVMRSVPQHEVEELFKTAIKSVGDKANEAQYLINGITKYKDTPAAKALADAKALSDSHWRTYWDTKESAPEAAANAYKLYEQNLRKENELRHDLSQELFGGKPFKLSSDERELLLQLERPEENLKNLSDKYARLQQDITGLHTGDLDVLKKHTDTYSLYKRLAGETEARNVPIRQNMSDSERRVKPAWETQEYPYSEQIISRTPTSSLNSLTPPYNAPILNRGKK